MDFRHLIVTCLFSKLRLPFDNQKVKENYAIFLFEDGVFKLVQSDDEAFYGCKTKPSFQDLHIFQHYLSDNMYINNI